jgi:hypothetical protein
MRRPVAIGQPTSQSCHFGVTVADNDLGMLLINEFTCIFSVVKRFNV